MSLSWPTTYVNALYWVFIVTPPRDFCDTSKVYSIQNKVNMPNNFNVKRSGQLVISRIRIGHSKLTQTYLLNGKSNLSAYFVNVLWLDITYFWSVLTHFAPGTYFVITYSLLKNLLSQVNINNILQFLQECDF